MIYSKLYQMKSYNFFTRYKINTKGNPVVIARQLRKVLKECTLSVQEREFVNFLLTETNLAG